MDLPPAPLVDRLRLCAELWVDATDASLPKLGRTVVNDGGFFARIEAPGASTTTATLEKFARFLSDPVNWRDAAVPEEVIAFAHVTGVTPLHSTTSTGQAGELSAAPEAAQ